MPIIFVIFFFLRVWGIPFGLPHEGIHPTEGFSVLQAIEYRSTLNFKPVDFQHPTFFQYLLSVISFFLSASAGGRVYFYILGRLISCLASFLSVYFLYRLSGKLLNSKALGLLAVSFLGLNLLSIQYAHYAVPDSLSALFVVLALLFSLRIISDGRMRDYLCCGLFCGLSVAAKFSGVVSLAYLLSACAISSGKEKEALFKKIIPALLIACFAFFILSPYHVLYFQEALRDFTKYSSDKGYASGFNSYLQGAFNYFFVLLPGVFGLFGFVSAAAGLTVMYFKSRDKALLLSIPTLLYLLVVSKDQGTIQNVLCVLPALALLAAYLILCLKEMKVSRIIILSLVIFSLLPNLLRSAAFDYFLLKKDTRVLAEEWLLKNGARAGLKNKARAGFERYTPYDLDYFGNPGIKASFDAVYFIPSLSMYPAAYYKDNGFDYIVTSGFRRDNYIYSCRKQGFCREADNYATYDAKFRKAAEFRAPRLFKLIALPSPWGTWPHNPDITIYKVSD